MVGMLRALALIFADLFKSRARVEAEIVVLRHQLNIALRKRKAPLVLTNLDRSFLIWLFRLFPSILKLMRVVRPATVVRWHRGGFRAYWRWKSGRGGGRPRISKDLRDLIRRMSSENALWGAPRIHGELLKLGFTVAQSTVAKYMAARPICDGEQNWKTFLRNQAEGVASIDLLTVPTIWFEQVLQQHVAPSLRGLAIRHVPIAPTTVVVVIDVPATTGDPHQVSDGKYYRRHNFSRLAMEHYEIRDMFRRTTTPDLFVDVSFHGHGEFWVTYRMNEEISQPVPLTLTMGNRSDQLALYCLVMLGIDTNLKILKRGEFEAVTSPPSNDRTWIVHKHSVPHRFPIFKGPTIWMEPVELGLPTNLLGATHQFKITVSTRAPGHMRDEDWYIRQVGGKLRLLPPIR